MYVYMKWTLVYIYVYGSMCMCVREEERKSERERKIACDEFDYIIGKFAFNSKSHFFILNLCFSFNLTFFYSFLCKSKRISRHYAVLVCAGIASVIVVVLVVFVIALFLLFFLLLLFNHRSTLIQQIYDQCNSVLFVIFSRFYFFGIFFAVFPKSIHEYIISCYLTHSKTVLYPSTLSTRSTRFLDYHNIYS